MKNANEALKNSKEALNNFHNHTSSIRKLVYELHTAHENKDYETIKLVNEDIKNKEKLIDNLFQLHNTTQDNFSAAINRLVDAIDRRHTKVIHDN